LKISYDSSPTRSVLRASKLFADTTVSFIYVRVPPHPAATTISPIR
jgi:hypothetical protein